MPPRLSSVMSRKNASRPSGSSPAIGSSRIRYSGFVASTPAMATRRFSPPERPIGGWSWTFSNEKPTVSSAQRTRACFSAALRPLCFRPKATSFSTVVSKSWHSGYWNTMPTLRRRMLRS